MNYLPVNRQDLTKRGWDELDIIFVSGDAYVDHPAWAAALLGRFLEKQGFRVGIIAQPDWQSLEDIRKLGQPRLFFAVSAGNMDSMVSHYTADKKRRSEDLYSPGGQAGLRPDRTSIVYTNLIRQAWPSVPVVIGGVEPSLRRLAHYDYWSDKVRRSLLADSKADLLVYGMGEYPLLEIARQLKSGKEIRYLTNLRSTVYMSKSMPEEALALPAYEKVKQDQVAFAAATRLIHQELNPYCARPLAQQHGERWVVVNPPALPLSTAQMDEIYGLEFTRRAHPVYEEQGGIPALEPVQFSVTTHRGCFGGCAFCSLGLHQGKFIQNRSKESIIHEVEEISRHPDFKGTIPDVGAASANMFGLHGKDEQRCQSCRRESCLYPTICRNLQTDHSPSVKLWKELRRNPRIKHMFVASGVRYDLILKDSTGQYLKDLCKYHVGGQLKIAPEHVSDRVLKLMRKPSQAEYKKFIEKFQKENQQLGKEQYLVPYFISAHPGSQLHDTIELAEFVRDNLQYYPEQVQNFTPTPMTVSTCMYHTGLDPVSQQSVYIPRQIRERKWQRALLQYRDSRNRSLVREALQSCGREDLLNSSPQGLLARAAKPAVKPNERPKRLATGKKNQTAKESGNASRKNRKSHSGRRRSGAQS
ncbi:MAG TPA: YgiQ family radical SAM protein [Syntrophomonas sp.]|nr:YgiQ family radical SAM protein [Syntrophomonas sp.]HRW12938.1 YgiQ family radical SAM protein [Syntrophomonas sp.]